MKVDTNPTLEVVRTLPVLPIKNTVLFPYMFIPLSVGRPSSRAAVEAAMSSEDKMFVVVAQRDAANEQPGDGDLYTVGTLAVIKKLAHGPDTVELLVQGLERVTVQKIEQTEPFLKATVATLPFPADQGTELEALHRTVCHRMLLDAGTATILPATSSAKLDHAAPTSPVLACIAIHG